jgi:hypothetical protein
VDLAKDPLLSLSLLLSFSLPFFLSPFLSLSLSFSPFLSLILSPFLPRPPMSTPNPNPFAPPSTQLGLAELKSELSADDVASGAVCIRRGLLEREVVLAGEHPWTLEYSGINFRQRVRLNGETKWWCITWIWFQRFIEFKAPLGPGLPESHWVVEVVVGRFLRLVRFRINVDGQDVYIE